MDVEEQERVDAVNRYIKGDMPVNICRDVDRSKTWLLARKSGTNQSQRPLKKNAQRYRKHDCKPQKIANGR